MNLYTYHDWVAEHGHEDELRLLTLWRQHHAALGFNPVVLQPYHARQHPAFESIHAACAALPTVNPKGYEVACFDRWIAMAVYATGYGVLMDYDTFLYPQVWDDLNMLLQPVPAELQRLKVFQVYVPCLVMGTRKTFVEWAWRFARFTPPAGCKHASDMTILEHYLGAEPAAFEALNIARSFTEPGWETALAVHYNNGAMTPNKKTPRWKHIPQLRKQSLPAS